METTKVYVLKVISLHGKEMLEPLFVCNQTILIDYCENPQNEQIVVDDLDYALTFSKKEKAELAKMLLEFGTEDIEVYVDDYEIENNIDDI